MSGDTMLSAPEFATNVQIDDAIGRDFGAEMGVVQVAQAEANSSEQFVELPLANAQQVVVVPVAPGDVLVLPTDSTAGVLGKFGPEGNLAFVIDGRTIIFQGFIRANDVSPVRIVTSDGDPVDPADIVASTDPNLDIQTAAGPATGDQAEPGSGIFTPFTQGSGLGLIDAEGLLSATNLAYKLIDNTFVEFVEDEEDDSDFEETPPLETSATIDPDGPAFLKEDVETPIALTATPGPNASVTQIVLDNIPTGWTINQAAIALSSGSIGPVSLVGATLTIDVVGAAAGVPITATVLATAAEDTDVDGTALIVKATAIRDSLSVTASSIFDAPVDAVLDQFLDVAQTTAPTIGESNSSQNVSLHLLGVLAGGAGNPFSNSFAGGMDGDSSEFLPTTAQITLPNTLIDLELGAGFPSGTTLLESAPNSGTWVLTATSSSNLQAALSFVEAVVPGGFDGVITGSILVTSTEANTPAGSVPISGLEPDISDNVTADTAGFTVTVKAATGPVVEDALARVDEDGLPNVGNGDAASGDDDTDLPPDAAAGEAVFGEDLPVNWNGEAGAITLQAGDWSALRTLSGNPIVGVGGGTELLQGFDSADAPGGVPNLAATPLFEIRILDAASGAYQVTILKPLLHPDTNDNSADDNADDALGSFEDNVLIPVVATYTNSGGVATGSLVISVDDDAPSVNRLTQQTTDAQVVHTNLMLILDVSGSMGDDSGLNKLDKLDLAVAAIKELIDVYDGRGDVKIQIVTFSTDAQVQDGGVWLTVDEAGTFLDTLTSAGRTNYDAALTTAMAAFNNSGKIVGAENVAYFLSDNNPNEPGGSIGVNAAEEAAWIDFLKLHDINAFALGVGTGGIDPAQLHPIAYNGALEVDTQGKVITDLNLLTPTLANTVGTTVTGNLMTDGSNKVGADGGGRLSQISVGATMFSYDGATILRSGDFLPFTDTAGILMFSVGGFEYRVDMNSGAYTYSVIDSTTLPHATQIGYAVVDGDGDASASTLTITISDADNAPIARDDRIFTNVTGSGASTVVPDYAFLWNDTDADGNLLAFNSVSKVSGLTSVIHGSGLVTITDNDADGGSFTYKTTANGKSDEADVIVDRGQAGDGSLNGDGLDNIIIDLDTSSTLNGLEGNDVIFGYGGKDVISGGSGRDLLIGGAGNDKIALSDGVGDHDTVLITGALDGNDTLSNFGDGVTHGGADSQDYLNLDLLFDSLGVSTDARAARVQITDVGTNAIVTIDLTANGFDATDLKVTLSGIASPANLTVGEGQTDDIQVGTA